MSPSAVVLILIGIFIGVLCFYLVTLMWRWYYTPWSAIVPSFMKRRLRSDKQGNIQIESLAHHLANMAVWIGNGAAWPVEEFEEKLWKKTNGLKMASLALEAITGATQDSRLYALGQIKMMRRGKARRLLRAIAEHPIADIEVKLKAKESLIMLENTLNDHPQEPGSNETHYYFGSVMFGGSRHEVTADQITQFRSGDKAISQQDWNMIAQELRTLRDELRQRAKTTDEDLTVASVGQAADAAEKKNGPEMFKKLGDTGRWAFDVATQIGVRVAAEVIKNAAGLA